MFSLQQNQRTRGLNRFCWEGWGRKGGGEKGKRGGGEEAKTMYTHVSKCKNDKIKCKKIKIF
jgi:hypothetical protein